MTTDGYLRYPHIRGDLLTFVAEDDVWIADSAGGRAHRLSADHVPALTPRISPDGSRVAWAARRGEVNEVFVAPTDGGVSRQLTFWGQPATRITGWASDDEVLVLSTTGEGDRVRMFAHAVPVDGGPSRRLPYGWAGDLAFGPDLGVLLSSYFWTEPARWKRYRGGTASQLWLDRDGSGTFRRIFADLPASLAFPTWTQGVDGRQHVAFCSDHEGRGQLYSARIQEGTEPSSGSLVRRTEGDLYVRHASSDGQQVVYCAGGDVFALESLDDGVEPRRIDLRIGGARPLLRPYAVKATSHLGTISSDRGGRASAIESRGTVSWVSHRSGPVRTLAAGSAVRRRLPVVLDDARVVWVTDVDGDDSLEVVDLLSPDASPQPLVAAGTVGRVVEMAASPDGRRVVLTSHDGRLLSCAVPAEVTAAVAPQEIDSITGDISGLAFSPDSRWLAWSASGPGPWEDLGPKPLRQIKIADLDTGRVTEVTALRFTDTDPVFTLDGKYLAFLSIRSLDPVYDSYSFDLSFPAGCRPYLIALAADVPSPFDPIVGGHPLAPPEPEQEVQEALGQVVKGDAGGAEAASATSDILRSRPLAPKTVVDIDGLEQRIVPVPVEAGRYSGMAAVKRGLVWLREPLRGELGDNQARVDAQPERARVEHFDLRSSTLTAVLAKADRFDVSGDGSRLLVVDGDRLVVVPSDKAAPAAGDADDTLEVDLDRLRVEVDPPAEWRQMLDETWRLMRDNFWREDMGGVDWQAARDRYEPMLERLGSHDDLIDLIWEMHGELGSSHAYAIPPKAASQAINRQGLLGADLAYGDDGWQITRIVPGDASDPKARSPLLAAGVNAHVGDVLVAVNGRRTSRTVSPLSLLVGMAGKPVELTLRRQGSQDVHRVAVLPLADEIPLRYQDWVTDRRAYVHAQTDGRIGYLHVPDMMSAGWAQLHRDLRTEMSRDALIVDVRSNRGGHTSQLVLEKLSRRIIGWDLVRGYGPDSYPGDARRGPMVTVADMFAGSDGDIIVAAIQSLGLGPVVGTRTWGGVIGIDGRYSLVDGTMVTQPRFSFWFEKFGWGVENYGVDPDIEVAVPPQDRVAGNDVQLDRALQEATRLLQETPPVQPPRIPDLPSVDT